MRNGCPVPQDENSTNLPCSFSLSSSKFIPEVRYSLMIKLIIYAIPALLTLVSPKGHGYQNFMLSLESVIQASYADLRGLFSKKMF